MNSVIVIENIMDKWLENQPEPTIYYQCPLCLNYFNDKEGDDEIINKDENNQIEMIDCCIYCQTLQTEL
jgi:hypothetical protein